MSSDEIVWKHSASIKSSVLLHNKDTNINMQFPNRVIEIRLSVPEAVEDERWSGWETAIRSTWLYKVSINFLVTNEEDAVSKACKNLDDLVNIISFMASSPVQVESYGSVITPARESIPGQTYTQIIIGAVTGHLDPRELKITEEGIEQQLMPMFMSNALSREGSERISRSLRWLQHSYQALTPVDEFLCLMFSIEGIARLLGEGKSLYWRCERCNTQYQGCPNCGKSTARVNSGSALVRDFLKLYVGWSGRKWNDIWSLRSKIAHGDQDLSKSEETTIITSLADLEYAVVKALKFVLGLPDQAAPHATRYRPPFGFSRMELEFKVPESNLDE